MQALGQSHLRWEPSRPINPVMGDMKRAFLKGPFFNSPKHEHLKTSSATVNRLANPEGAMSFAPF